MNIVCTGKSNNQIDDRPSLTIFDYNDHTIHDVLKKYDDGIVPSYEYEKELLFNSYDTYKKYRKLGYWR